jgi:ATP-dependent HslUV protease ATP-binding subunit HslU
MLKVSSSSACVLKHVQSNVRTSSWNLRNTSSTSINTRRITNISASLRPRYLSQHSRLNVHLNSLPSLTMTELNSLGLQFSSGTTDSNESNNDTLKDEDSTKSEEEKHTSSTKEEWSKASGLADILRPKQVVEELEKNIIGQAQAKKAVAIAIRNRWRRQQLEGDMRAEVTPKNILMVGPTGSGKTEIARRVAKLGDAPFVKVEATKFTEVGFHGKDVDTIIHDLVQASIRLTIEKRSARHAKLIKEKVDERILQSILGADAEENTLKTFRSKIQQGLLEDREVTIELPPETDGSPKMLLVVSGVHHSIGGMNKQNGGDRTEKKTLTVKEAREILERIEKDKLMNNDDILTEAVAAVENV